MISTNVYIMSFALIINSVLKKCLNFSRCANDELGLTIFVKWLFFKILSVHSTSSSDISSRGIKFYIKRENKNIILYSVLVGV